MTVTTNHAGGRDEAARLDAAVKPVDGFFTTFFVSPYSKYVARALARRGVTPNAVTIASAVVGALAAAAFATGERPWLVAGAVLVQVAFTLDCVDGQIARYTGRSSTLGAWLDSVLDRTKEYAIYAGLAIGAARAGDDVWLLACCALALQTTRHALDFSHPRGAVAAAPPSARDPLVWPKRILAFPIGERFAAISLTAALWNAGTTFTVLLVWGAIAFLYTAAGRAKRASGAAGGPPADGLDLLRLQRDDGPIARAIGRALRPLVHGSAAGRWDWMGGPARRAAELGGIVWLATLAGDETLPAAFALLAAIAYRHYDVAYRLRLQRRPPPRRLDALTAGWDGRLLAVAALVAAGAPPAAFYAAAALLAAVLVGESVTSWRRFASEGVTTSYDDQEATE